MKLIRKSTNSDIKRIEELRISEFSRSTEFSLLKPEPLMWSELDSQSLVLVVLDGENAISTMRGVKAEDRKYAESILQCTVPEDTLFPSLIFTSAATLKPLRKKGFNQLLRLYFLHFGIFNNIKTFMSPVYKNAPRIDFMKTLGYKLITPEKNWQKKLNPKSERQLAILKKESFKNAINIIEERNYNLIKEFPWKGININEILL